MNYNTPDMQKMMNLSQSIVQRHDDQNRIEQITSFLERQKLKEIQEIQQRHEEEKKRIEQEMQRQRDEMMRAIENEHQKKTMELEAERL